MSYNIPRFELDITGLNPSNLIIDEPHVLSSRDVRSVSPLYGPYFNESVVVKDGATVLVKDIDYQLTELHQEATLKYGKEISTVILIINPSVSSNVTITYQTLGGHYINDGAIIANLYESVINDNRPVNWNNVFNKPSFYPPTLHRHLLEDVYGFEAVVDALERIRNAITLGQLDLVLALIEELLANYNCGTLPKVIPNSKLLTYDAFLFFMTNRFLLSDYAIEFVTCKQLKGDSFEVVVKTKNVPDNTNIRLEIYRQDPLISLIYEKVKTAKIVNNTARAVFYMNSLDNIEDKYLYVGVKLNINDEEFTAVTYRVNVIEHMKTNTGYLRILTNKDLSYDMDYAALYADNKDRIYTELFYEN